MPDRSGQTEEPTQRRLQKAREEGQFPAAREFVSALQFMVFLVLLGAGGEDWFQQLRVVAQWLFSLAFTRDLRAEDLTAIAVRMVRQLFLPLILAGVGVATAALAFRLVTTRFGFSLKKLAPDLSRLNPGARLRELPRQNLPALVQAAVLLPVFLWAVYVVARDRLEAFLALPLGSVRGGFSLLAIP
jgi:flagellar biosynthesis protein FlhB